MNVLDNNYQVHGQDASGRLDIVGFIYNDGGTMPNANEFDGFTLLLGSKLVDVTTGAMYYFDGSGNWFRRQNSMFENVYSKTEIDTMLASYASTAYVDGKLLNYYTNTEVNTLLNEMKNYILICNSSLNLISIHDGISTGYFCQDLGAPRDVRRDRCRCQRQGAGCPGGWPDPHYVLRRDPGAA